MHQKNIRDFIRNSAQKARNCSRKASEKCNKILLKITSKSALICFRSWHWMCFRNQPWNVSEYASNASDMHHICSEFCPKIVIRNTSESASCLHQKCPRPNSEFASYSHQKLEQGLISMCIKITFRNYSRNLLQNCPRDASESASEFASKQASEISSEKCIQICIRKNQKRELGLKVLMDKVPIGTEKSEPWLEVLKSLHSIKCFGIESDIQRNNVNQK